MSLARGLMMVGLALCSGACTTYGVVANKPLAAGGDQPSYSISDFSTKLDLGSDELRMYMAFPGGGTRAAALAFGGMQELHDTRVWLNGREQSLLDAVSGISSVSGGSFTSAYYGLFGERLFVDFEERFLRVHAPRAIVQCRNRKSGGRKLHRLATRRCTQIKRAFTRSVAQKPRGQTGGKILHPPCAFVIALQFFYCGAAWQTDMAGHQALAAQ